jgi:hypothetical protein
MDLFSRKKTSNAPEAEWPQFQDSDNSALRGWLDAFWRAENVAQTQGPIEGLMDLARVTILDASSDKNIWEWFARKVAATDTPDDAQTAMRIALFTYEWHENYVPRAGTAWLILGRPSEEQIIRIQGGALDRVAMADGDVVIRAKDEVTIREFSRYLSKEMGRVVEPVASPAEPSGAEVLDTLLAEAESGDRARQALVAAGVAQAEGDSELALEILEEGGRLGDPECMLGAANLAHSMGRMGVRDYWNRAAADAGHPVGMYNCGVNAFSADGDVPEASRWLEAAFEAGSAAACAALTEIHDRCGDQAAGALWTERGARAGHPWCLERHARNIVSAGNASYPALLEALPFAEDAAAQGLASAISLAGMLTGHAGNQAQARYWLEKAVAAGDPDAPRLIAQLGLGV